MKKSQLSIVLISLFCIFCFACKKDKNNDKLITSVTDIEGNVYKVIKIGEQYWTKENLRTKTLRDYTEIDIVTDKTEWSNQTKPAMTFFNNQETAHKDNFGGLYNWYAVKTNKLCPAGWRVPNKDDYQTLINTLGGASVAGGKMKDTGLQQTGTGYWEKPNEGASNSSNFTGQPSGYRSASGSFAGFGANGNWWIQAEIDTEIGQYFTLNFQQAEVRLEQFDKKVGMSIRCVKE